MQSALQSWSPRTPLARLRAEREELASVAAHMATRAGRLPIALSLGKFVKEAAAYGLEREGGAAITKVERRFY